MRNWIKKLLGPSRADLLNEMREMREEHREWAKSAEVSKTHLMSAFIGLSLRMAKYHGGSPEDVKWLEEKVAEYRRKMDQQSAVGK